jgi:hypothetical protein
MNGTGSGDSDLLMRPVSLGAAVSRVIVAAMAAVGFRLADRVYGLSEAAARFLATQLRPKLTVPARASILADEISAQADATYATGGSRDIVLNGEAMIVLAETMNAGGPPNPEDADAWHELHGALRRELEQDSA